MCNFQFLEAGCTGHFCGLAAGKNTGNHPKIKHRSFVGTSNRFKTYDSQITGGYRKKASV